MQTRIPRLSIALAASLLVACGPVATSTRTATHTASHPSPTPVAAASPIPAPHPAAPPLASPVPTPGAASTLIGKVKLPDALQAAGTVTLAEAGIISDHGAGLIGKVKAPASLISDHGGGLVSNNGGGLVSNNGGGVVSNNSGSLIGKTKRQLLAALDQQPVAGAPVFVLDAAGRVVVDATGTPLAAVTDATGSYQLPGFAAGHNLVAAVDLGTKGLERAVIPATHGSTAATAADVDLISTLTTGYILDQYVRSQADPVKTFDRLPADVEADTRAKASAAFTAASVPPPDTLATDRVDAAVTSLRQQSGSFDAQMDLVRRLLIVAGQADLGSGRPGTQVSLGLVDGLATAPDGTVYIATDPRVWRLGADGRVRTAFGSGGAGDPDLVDGQDATKVPKQGQARIAVDAQGRLLVLETGWAGHPAKLLRVEADGKVKQLWRGTDLAWALVLHGDEIWIFAGGYYANPEWWVVPASGTPELRATMTQVEMFVVDGIQAAGSAPDGSVLVASLPVRLGPPPGLIPGLPVITQPSPPPAGIYRFDPAQHTFALVPDAVPAGTTAYALDGLGDVFWRDTAGALQMRVPGGQATQVLGTDDGDVEAPYRIEARAQDGTVYHMPANRSQVMRLAANAETAVAGLAPGAAIPATFPANARDFGLAAPSGVAPGEAGGFYLADRDRHQIYVIDATDTLDLVAGTGEGGAPNVTAPDPTGPARAAAVRSPSDLVRDAQGHLYFIDGFSGSAMAIRRLTPGAGGWTIDTVAKASADEAIERLVARPDGTLYYSTWLFNTGGARLYRVAPGGTPEAASDLPTLSYGLAVAPDGTVYALLTPDPGKQITGGRVAVLAPGATAPRIVTSTKLPYFAAALACDPQGRLYVADPNANTIFRYDFAGDTVTPVVGKGSPHFAGDGVDDGVAFPIAPTFDAAGNLFFIDFDHLQVKRVAAGEL